MISEAVQSFRVTIKLLTAEVLTAVKMSILLLCIVAPYGLISRYQLFRGISEDGGSMSLRNVDLYQQVHTALQLRNLTSIVKLLLIPI